MRYKAIPRGLVDETKAIIRLYFFLRYDIGLRDADRLTARQLKALLVVISGAKKRVKRSHK